MEKNNKQFKFIAAAIFFVVALFFIFVIARSNNKSTEPTEESVVSLADTVIIDNTTKLSDVLLAEQYSAVYETTADYIRSEIGKSIESARIIGTPSLLKNGNVVFEVSTVNPSKSFRVVLDRTRANGVIEYSIPADKYRKVIDVFGEYQDRE